MSKGEKIRYWYGIKKVPNIEGWKVVPFVVKKPPDFDDDNVLEVYDRTCVTHLSYKLHLEAVRIAGTYNNEDPSITETIVKEIEAKHQLQKEIRYNRNLKRQEKSDKKLAALQAEINLKNEALLAKGPIGRIATHYDEANKTHHAIILDRNEDRCLALFFSSSDKWNYNARLATKNDKSLAGFHNSRPTYLAPVTRHYTEFILTDVSISEEWRQSLLNEFPWDSAKPW